MNSPKTGYSFAGFCFPQVGGIEALTYGDLKVNCDEAGDNPNEGWVMMADSIVVLDGGSYVMDVVYVPEWVADIYTIAKGWYEMDVYDDGADYNHSEDLCWNAGEGFEVCILNDVGATVTIKSAIEAENAK